jgi:hypothetical protein
MTVSTINITTLHRLQSDISILRDDPSGPTPYDYLVVYPQAWSSDDKYFVLTNLYQPVPDREGSAIAQYLVNSHDLHAIALDLADQFLSWSSYGDPLEYVYIHHPHFPDLMDRSIRLGHFGQEEKFSSIYGFGSFDLDILSHLSLEGRITWQPDGKPLVTAVRRGPGEFELEYAVLRLDFQHGSWKTVSRGIPGAIVNISPDGRWILFMDDLNLSLWDTSSNTIHYRNIIPFDA